MPVAAAAAVVAAGYNTVLAVARMPAVAVRVRDCSHRTVRIDHNHVEYYTAARTESIAEGSDYTPCTVAVRRTHRQVRIPVPRE